MRLYIDADLNSKTGWNGYDLIANLNAPTAAGLSLHLIKDGKSTELPRIRHSVKGTDLELSIPRAHFGTAPLVRFDFKWADNQQKEADVTEFALHGDSAPDRRFNYRYDQSVTEALIKSWTAAAAQARLSSAK